MHFVAVEFHFTMVGFSSFSKVVKKLFAICKFCIRWSVTKVVVEVNGKRRSMLPLLHEKCISSWWRIVRKGNGFSVISRLNRCASCVCGCFVIGVKHHFQLQYPINCHLRWQKRRNDLIQAYTTYQLASSGKFSPSSKFQPIENQVSWWWIGLYHHKFNHCQGMFSTSFSWWSHAVGSIW